MFDARTIHSKEVLARIVDAFGDKVFDTVIKRTVKFPDASVSAEPILSYALPATPRCGSIPPGGTRTDLQGRRTLKPPHLYALC